MAAVQLPLAVQPPDCALRRCGGRLGCLCVRQGQFSQEAARQARPATSPARPATSPAVPRQLPRRRPSQQQPARRAPAHPVDAFAATICVDLAAEPALRWLATVGSRASLPTAWELKAENGRTQYREKATGQLQDDHPQRDYYRELAHYCRGVQARAGAAAPEEPQTVVEPEPQTVVEPEPEPEPEMGPWGGETLARGFSEVGEEKQEEGEGAQTKVRSKTKKKQATTLNSAAAKSSRAILRLACAELGWQDEPLTNDKGQVFWCVGELETAARLERLMRSQRLSRIPGASALCQKRPFALLMRAAQERDPE